MIGSLGNLTSFSFYANKNLTTAEGGMVVTEDPEKARQIEILRLHGLSRDAWKRYSSRRLLLSDIVLPGYKCNMTDLAASIGIHQLAKLERFLQVRERYATIYDEVFKDFEGVTLQPRPVDPENRHALHLYTLTLNPECFAATRNDIIEAIMAEGIGAALHYRALHTHPWYRDTYGYRDSDFPNAFRIGENIFSLPLSPAMTMEDVEDVIEAVTKVLKAYRR
jgi:dTDP-4-amino-4,6-dideoxygalactose transaminase